ncbi:MAG: hypothetical protein ACOCW7_01145 [Bacteroidota bacterium]
MKFHTKFKTVEADVFMGTTQKEGEEFSTRNNFHIFRYGTWENENGLLIPSNEGFKVLKRGDWLVFFTDEKYYLPIEYELFFKLFRENF